MLDPNDPAEETAGPNWFLHEHLTHHVPSDTFIPARELFEGDDAWPEEVRQAHRHPRNRFGHFILVTQVGCGASGSVFRAWDTRWKQFAGLKILHEMTPEVLDTFIREASRAARLRHPSIATSYEAGGHENHWYVAMTYIQGRPIDAEPRPVALNVELMRDACRAVDHAHSQGVTHGDLKASNILVDTLDRVFVTDFGSPRRTPGAKISGDIYDLGAVLHDLAAADPEASPELRDIAARAMSSQPFVTAGEMADALDRLLATHHATGSYGLPRRLARKWAPVAAVGVALAVIFTWIVPAFLGRATAAVESKSTEYNRAALALLQIEECDEGRAARIREFIATQLAPLLDRAPAHLHARVLKARAAYVGGDREGALDELSGLAMHEPLDYRVGFLRALIGLERELDRSLPLPAPEAPGPDREGELPDLGRFHEGLTEVLDWQVDGDSPLFAEHRRDAEGARGLILLVDGRWQEACEKLAAVTQTQRLPVYVAARRAAAYLARRFDEVLDEPGTQFALAIETSASPIDDAKRLHPLFADDLRREEALFCWAARRCAERGIDPARLGATLSGREARGIYRTAQLRHRALSGADTGWDEVRDLLNQPATWMGRIAAIESLLGAGRHAKLRGADSEALFAEALARAESFPREPGWNIPHLLRAEALLGLGRTADALSEAKLAKGSLRALLVAAEASRRLEDWKGSMAYADAALAQFRGHPEALTLRAAASIRTGNPESTLRDAIARLSRAIQVVPDYVEARYHRASAYLLLAGQEDLEAAAADLNRVLAAVPELAAARALRGIVRAAQGRHADSTADLEEALKWRHCPDRSELERWLRQDPPSAPK